MPEEAPALDVTGEIVPVTVTMDNLGFSARSPENGESETVIHGVCATVRPGEMLGIFGPGSAGKSALLQLMAGRIVSQSDSLKVWGQTLFNGIPLCPDEIRRIAGVILDGDFLLCTSITPRQFITLSARQKMPGRSSRARVQELIRMLHLDTCCDTPIGDPNNPGCSIISGGEKRRTVIGAELVDPTTSVLLFDGAFSGLDSTLSQEVAGIVRAMADAGVTVIATLDQPRPSVLMQFDQLMLLNEGRVLYYGSLDDYENYLTETLQANIPLSIADEETGKKLGILIDLAADVKGRGQHGISLEALPQDTDKYNFAARLEDLFKKSDWSEVDVARTFPEGTVAKLKARIATKIKAEIDSKAKLKAKGANNGVPRIALPATLSKLLSCCSRRKSDEKKE